jgi:hypothetical protein
VVNCLPRSWSDECCNFSFEVFNYFNNSDKIRGALLYPHGCHIAAVVILPGQYNNQSKCCACSGRCIAKVGIADNVINYSWGFIRLRIGSSGGNQSRNKGGESGALAPGAVHVEAQN